jgi:hypothetical protein
MATTIWFRIFCPSICSIRIYIKVYTNITLPVILYGWESWPFTLTQEHRLRVFERRVLRKISGPEREEVIGDWRKLHNEELQDLYCLLNMI